MKKTSTPHVRIWRKRNPEQVRSYARIYRARIKAKVFQNYGNKCNCCEESNPLFLTIDHINNDGNREKRQPSGKRLASGAMYLKIVREQYPQDLQLLCWNCNMGKRMNKGVCPHLVGM